MIEPRRVEALLPEQKLDPGARFRVVASKCLPDGAPNFRRDCRVDDRIPYAWPRRQISGPRMPGRCVDAGLFRIVVRSLDRRCDSRTQIDESPAPDQQAYREQPRHGIWFGCASVAL